MQEEFIAVTDIQKFSKDPVMLQMVSFLQELIMDRFGAACSMLDGLGRIASIEAFYLIRVRKRINEDQITVSTTNKRMPFRGEISTA